MKKIVINLFALMILITVSSMNVKAETVVADATSAAEVELVEQSDADMLVQRLEEIKQMDKSQLTFQEKRELRKEVKAISKELKERPYLYISSAALLVILIVVLLLR
jgi:hypothetical protein